jgi:hypothetical protein
MSREMNGQQIARFFNNHGGPCTLLGVVVNTTPLQIIYIVRDRRANIPKRLVHLEPCRNCSDHPKTRFPKTNGERS